MSLSIPQFPSLGARLVGALPLAPLAFACRRFVAGVSERHPGLFRRLGDQADKSFLLDALDVPVVFLLRPRLEGPSLEPFRRGEEPGWDARIAGPLAALLGMVHGAYDGDALFFSRDIVIEGDTEAVLALRNAVDDAELDLPVEAAALFGPFSGLIERPMRGVLPLVERLSGVALSRAAGAATARAPEQAP